MKDLRFYKNEYLHTNGTILSSSIGYFNYKSIRQLYWNFYYNDVKYRKYWI